MTTVTSPWPGLGQPLFEMCWVYMAIAQIAQDPPLCQTDKRGKKVFQTILASPYTPGQIYAKKCSKPSLQAFSRPQYWGKGGIFLGKGSPFLKCVSSIWALPKSLKSPPPSLSNGQTWKKVFQTILASPYIPGHTLVKKSTPNHLGKPKTPPQYWRRGGIFAEGAGYFHSPGQSKGFGTSEHPICMKLLPDYFWH